MTEITRRGFLVGTIAVGAAAALPVYAPDVIANEVILPEPVAGTFRIKMFDLGGKLVHFADVPYKAEQDAGCVVLMADSDSLTFESMVTTTVSHYEYELHGEDMIDGFVGHSIHKLDTPLHLGAGDTLTMTGLRASIRR